MSRQYECLGTLCCMQVRIRGCLAREGSTRAKGEGVVFDVADAASIINLGTPDF